MAMDSFSRRRPPKFSEPIDFNLKANEFSYSNLLVDRFNGLFSTGWSTNDQHGLFNFSGNLNSTSNLTPASGESITNNNSSNSVNNFGNIGTPGIRHGGSYSSNLTHAINGINSNPFNTKGLNSYDYNNQWIAPPRSCPPIGTRDAFNSFSSTPRSNHTNSNNLSNTNNNLINSHNYNSTLQSANSLNRDNTHSNYHNNLTNGHQYLTSPNNTNNSYGIGNNNHHAITNNSNNGNSTNNTYTDYNSSLTGNNNLSTLPASYVPPRIRRRNPTCTECVFCKNNGQPPSFYKSHILKCPEGKIVCPVLRDYNCPICKNGGGERAHTLRYCPWNKPSFWQRATRL